MKIKKMRQSAAARGWLFSSTVYLKLNTTPRREVGLNNVTVRTPESSSGRDSDRKKKTHKKIQGKIYGNKQEAEIVLKML